METARAWAWETFGGAELGDARRVSRVVALAEAAAERPGGRVTDVCQSGAEREAAYRLLDGGRLDAEEMGRAMSAAAAQRCAGLARVIVPVDQTGISVVDRQGKKKWLSSHVRG